MAKPLFAEGLISEKGSGHARLEKRLKHGHLYDQWVGMISMAETANSNILSSPYCLQLISTNEATVICYAPVNLSSYDVTE